MSLLFFPDGSDYEKWTFNRRYNGFIIRNMETLLVLDVNSFGKAYTGFLNLDEISLWELI